MTGIPMLVTSLVKVDDPEQREGQTRTVCSNCGKPVWITDPPVSPGAEIVCEICGTVALLLAAGKNLGIDPYVEEKS